MSLHCAHNVWMLTGRQTFLFSRPKDRVRTAERLVSYAAAIRFEHSPISADGSSCACRYVAAAPSIRSRPKIPLCARNADFAHSLSYPTAAVQECSRSTAVVVNLTTPPRTRTRSSRFTHSSGLNPKCAVNSTYSTRVVGTCSTSISQ